MNTEPNILNLENSNPQPDKLPDAIPQFEHAGNGKIARLPKAIRDQVNTWLRDGLSSPEIIKRLGDAGQGLNPGHFHEYRKRGYQDWLRQREWLEHLTSKSEFSTDILSTEASGTLHEAGLRLAAAQMFDQLMRFSSASAGENAQPEPEQFARLVNALARLTREALAFQKYRDVCAQAAAAAELEALDYNRDLNHKESSGIFNALERFFGFKPGQRIGPRLSEILAKQNQSTPPPSQSSPPQPTEPPPPIKSDCRRRREESLINEQPNGTEPATTAAEKNCSTSELLSSRLPASGVSAKQAEEVPTNEPPAAGTDSSSEVRDETSLPQSKFKNQNSKMCAEVARVTPLASPTCPATASERRRISDVGGCTPPPQTTNHEPQTTHQSPIENRKSKIENPAEHCHYCRRFLPPRLPNGQRPFTHCQLCGTALRPLELLHLYCPDCGARMDSIFENNHRLADQCPNCFTALPNDAPDPPPEAA